MIQIPKHVLIEALTEADIPEENIDWEYSTGYGSRTFVSFVSEDGHRALARLCTVLGSMSEVEGEEDIDLHIAMSVAESATVMQRGRRSGFYFPGVEVVES